VSAEPTAAAAETVLFELAGGVATIMAARLEPGDVAEDVAARRLAEAARGPNVDMSAAFTGRVNLYAATRGIVLVDAARIDEINAIDESLTIATLAPFEVVEPRQMLATIKIIPFATPERVVKNAEEIAVAAVQEDVDAVAISSYQGGHVEFFEYLVRTLAERGAGHIRVYGGGGGTIVPAEIDYLHGVGVARIFAPEDGRWSTRSCATATSIRVCAPRRPGQRRWCRAIPRPWR